MPPPEPGGVTVTLREVYAQVLALGGEVRDMNAQLRERIAPTYVDHEARLRQLERWRYALPASLITACGSVVVSVVFALWKG